MSPSRASWLHASLLAGAFLVFAWPLALTPGLVAAAVAALAGTIAAERMDRARFRLWATLVVALAVGVAGAVALRGFLALPALAKALRPEVAIQVADALRWGFAAFAGALGLRALAVRYRAALAIEGAAVVFAVASTVAAHRGGMIARPLEVSDWFWQQGMDPVVAFLGVGLAGGLLLAGILAYRRSPKRTAVQLLLVLLLGISLAAFIHRSGQEHPKKSAVGGELERSKDDGRGNGAEARGHAGGSSTGDLPPPPGQKGSNNRPSAIVVFHRDVDPPGGMFYFRHAAFSQFNGVRLVEATIPGVDGDGRHDFPIRGRDVPGVHRAGVGRTEVATDVALLTRHSRMFTLTDATRVDPKPNPDPARFRRAYAVVSQVFSSPFEDILGSAPGDPRWNDPQWDHYLELPRDERYHDLARRIQATLKADFQADPLALALSIKAYLERNATYSFKRRYDGNEPTGDFLFSEEKLGYCVHLAHAAAYLLRALGIPARVSAGYAVLAENLAGGSALLIKEGDAHAWAEIYLERVGWVPIEVTPEKTDIEPTPFEEKDLQQLLGEMARKEGRFERPAREGPKLGELLSAIASWVPWVALALVVLAYISKLWRLWGAPRLDGAAYRAAYVAGLDRLSAVGIVRGRGESRERFAMRASRVAPSFRPLTAAHVARALGSRRTMGRADLTSLGDEIGVEVRRGVPAWRWVFGALNPVSWWWSR